MKKTITLTVNDMELKFHVGLVEYHKFQNEFQTENKVTPAKNFLTRTVTNESREALDGLISQGLSIDLAATLSDEFRPKVEIAVKKSTASSSR